MNKTQQAQNSLRSIREKIVENFHRDKKNCKFIFVKSSLSLKRLRLNFRSFISRVDDFPQKKSSKTLTNYKLVNIHQKDE